MRQLSNFQLPLLLMVLPLFFSLLSFSQGSIKSMSDGIGLHSFVVIEGDTVLIKIDSSYVMNKKVFNLFQDNYKRVQKGNPDLKKLMENYEEVIALQDTMLKTKEVHYQNLRSSFDSLLATSNEFVRRTDANVTSIDSSIGNATKNIENIQLLLTKSLDDLKYLNRQKFKWMIGGFSVGIAASAAIFLITR